MAPEPDTGGERMERSEAAAFLAERGVGVLSLADDDVAYGLPLSYGYDADADVVYFVLLRPGESSRKERFVETTERASFLVYDVESPGEWHSVIAEGSLRPTREDEDDRAVEVIETNAWYPDLFRESTPTRGVAGWALDVQRLTGVRGGDTPPTGPD
jgi:nitroimidazol reductase NimA-like FMN-containing flavoprotein (pyridoxamine 5'-phosphate oxidase superfamily)